MSAPTITPIPPPTPEQLEAWLRGRRSIRKFKPDSIDKATIERLIALAITAPSASNNQPWRFFVIQDRIGIDRLADIVQTTVDRIAAHIDPAFETAFRAYGDYFVRFRAAPVVLLVACRGIAVLSNLVRSSLPGDLREEILRMEEISGIDSAAMAVQNLLLAAGALGLGASAMTGPLIAESALKFIPNIPHGWRIAAVVPVGRPDEAPEPTPRKSLEQVVRWVPACIEGGPDDMILG